MADTYTGPALYVPVQMEALVLTARSYNALWSWAAPAYRALEQFLPVEGTPFKEQEPALPGHADFRGTLLHWALPDGVAHGTAGGGGVRYPDIPNRWLVVRKAVAADDAARWDYRSWIVASDYQDATGGSPFLDALGRPILLGKSWPLADWPGEAAMRTGTLTAPLNALGAGDATYAAYVPNVPTVLGFADTMAGCQPGPVTYALLGWYAAPATDPMQGRDLFGPEGWQSEAQWQELMAQRGWSVGGATGLADAKDAAAEWAKAHGFEIDPEDPRDILPARILCHSLRYEVGWLGPEGEPLTAVPTSNTLRADYVRPQVAVGNTQDEALTALIVRMALEAGLAPAYEADLQTVLTAFQCDAVALLDQPDGKAQLALRQQASWYGTIPAGNFYDVIGPQTDPQPDTPTPPPLTPWQATQLTVLNRTQEQLDATLRALQAVREELFLLWWKRQRLPKIRPQPLKYAEWMALIDSSSARATREVEAAGMRLRALRQRRDEAFIQLSATLEEQRLAAVPAPVFRVPNEPAWVVTGARRSFKHGEDTDPATDEGLFCRVNGQSYDAIDVAVDGATVTIRGENLGVPHFTHADLPRETNDLVAEWALLDETSAPLIATLAHPAAPWPLLSGIRTAQASIWTEDPPLGATILQTMFGLGAVPVYSSIRPWSPPWSPLFMDWKLRIAPGAATQAGALAPWAYPPPQNTPPEDLFTYSWNGPLPPPQDRAFTTSGRILVTPQAADTFVRRLERAIDLYADQPDMEAIIGMLQTALDYMLNADVLGQVNSGLNANLLQTSPLAFATPPPDDPVLKLLNGDSNPPFTFTSSPEPGADALRFNPLRAGHASLDALWFVDGWGQVFDVLKAAPAWSPIRAPDLITAQSGMLVELKPRLTQPARLCFDLLSATDDTQRVRIDGTANPVCGWIIPNRIDRSLFVYDAAGTAAGELFLAGEVAGWFPSPRNHKPPHGGKPEVKVENRHLGALLNGILDAADSAGALQALFALLDEVSFAIDTVAWGEQALPVLAGAPVAVVRARLMLELQGPPAARQEWNETGRDNTGGFEECEMNIALGSPELLDDGLIGFYTDDDYTSIDSAYRLRTPHDYVGTRTPRLRPAGSARLLTLLMAPQAKAHALPGLLPAETIILPQHFTIAPLAALEMLFRIGPLLGDTTGVAMPLPSVNQGSWSWLQYLRTDEFALPMPVTQSMVLATLPDAAGMAREGWLSLKPAGAPSVLSYALNPPNVPVTSDETNPSAVVLTITAYNGTGADQPVSRIGLAVPLGTDGAALTAFPEYIVPALPGMAGFTVQAEAPGRFVIQPVRAGVMLRAGETLKLTLAGVQVNRTAGSALLRLEETVDELLTTTLLLTKTGV